MFVLSSPAKRPITALAFGPDGRLLAAGGRGGVDIWDAVERRLLLAAWPDLFHLNDLLFDPGGRHLYAAATRGGGRVIDLADGTHRCFTPDPGGLARSLVLAPGGRLLACVGGFGHRDAFLGAWDLAAPGDPRPAWRTPPAAGFCEYALTCLAPGGAEFAVKESGPGRPPGGVIAVREVRSGGLVREFPRPSPSESYRRMLFAAGGDHLVVVSEPNLYRLEAATGRPAGVVGKPGRGSFADAVLHPGGEVLVTAHRGDRTANLWDARTLSVLRTYEWPVGRFRSVAVSPDGALAAAGNETGKVVVWDVDV